MNTLLEIGKYVLIGLGCIALVEIVLNVLFFIFAIIIFFVTGIKVW